MSFTFHNISQEFGLGSDIFSQQLGPHAPTIGRYANVTIAAIAVNNTTSQEYMKEITCYSALAENATRRYGQYYGGWGRLLLVDCQVLDSAVVEVTTPWS